MTGPDPCGTRHCRVHTAEANACEETLGMEIHVLLLVNDDVLDSQGLKDKQSSDLRGNVALELRVV